MKVGERSSAASARERRRGPVRMEICTKNFSRLLNLGLIAVAPPLYLPLSRYARSSLAPATLRRSLRFCAAFLFLSTQLASSDRPPSIRRREFSLRRVLRRFFSSPSGVRFSDHSSPPFSPAALLQTRIPNGGASKCAIRAHWCLQRLWLSWLSG